MIFGILGKYFLPPEIRGEVVRMVLQPVNDLFFRLLNAVSGPVIFLTVVITPKTERIDPLPKGAVEIKDCTFSAYFEDELGYMSYDGNIDTLWSCEGKNQWICYDLGEESSVSKASILWNKADQRKARFKIEISDDNENFKTLFDGEACGTTTTFEDYGIKGRGRYIRIYCMGNSDSDWNAIREIIIYK